MAATTTRQGRLNGATPMRQACALAWLAVWLLLGSLAWSVSEAGDEPGRNNPFPSKRWDAWLRSLGLRNSKAGPQSIHRTNRTMEVARQMLADAQRLAEKGDIPGAVQLAMRADRLAQFSAQTTSISWLPHEQQPAAFLVALETQYGLRQAAPQAGPIRLVHRELPQPSDEPSEAVAQSPSNAQENGRHDAVESAHDSTSSRVVPAAASGDATASRPSSETARRQDFGRAGDSQTAVSSHSVHNAPSGVAVTADWTDARVAATTLADPKCDASKPPETVELASNQRGLDVEFAREPEERSAATALDATIAPPALPPTPMFVPVSATADRRPAPLLMTAVVQFFATLAGLLAGVVLFVGVRLYVFKRYGADIGNLFAPAGSGLPQAAASSDAPQTPADAPPAEFLIPFPAPGPTYAERREAELRAFQQKEAAILKHVFEQNLKLREELRELDGSTA